MKKLLPIIMLVVASSCSSTSSQTTDTTQAAATSTPETLSNSTDGKRVRIKSIEDVGYPFYWLSTETSEGTPLELKVNLEEISNVPLDTLYHMVGKMVLVKYKIQEEEAVMDIELNGKTLLGEYGGQKAPAWKTVQGVLSAPEVSQGDLPGTIGLTLSDGTSRQYEFYVTEEIAQVHGKTVTIYYAFRKNNSVESILL